MGMRIDGDGFRIHTFLLAGWALLWLVDPELNAMLGSTKKFKIPLQNVNCLKNL
jgi:hypothetical protein